MKAFNFEQRKESELQKFVGLKGNVVEWRYGYVEKKIDYTLKTQGGEKPMNITTRYFLQMLYGKCTEGCITVTTLPDSRNEHIPVTELDKAAERIKVLGTSANTYYCVALRQEGLPSSVRGGIGQIHTVVCMVADVDVLGPAHKETALPKTEEEAIAFVNSLKLKPSIIVRSGNGVHAIWPLNEPFIIHNEDEREQIRELSAGFGMYVIAEGRKKGWKLDNVQDVPRMFRAPGSLNFKSNPPKRCEVYSAEEFRYPVTAFKEFKRITEIVEFHAESDLVGPAERMCEKCAFIDYCIENAATLPEPMWYTMISIVAITEDGQKKVHERSETYPGYSYDQTEEYYERAAKMSRPCSCRYIRDFFGFDCPKEGCGVRAPIVFAYYTIEERVKKLLEEELTVDEALEEKNLQLVRYAREHQPIQYFKLKEKYGKLKIGVRDLEKMLTTTGGKADIHEGGQEFCKALELDGMELNGLVVPKGWEVDMEGVRHIEFLNGVPYTKSAFSAPVYISRRMRNVDDEDVKLELAFYGDCRWRKIIVPRGDAMDKSKLVKYANQGLPVTSETSKEAVKYMEAFETSNKTVIPRHRSIERMGWVKNREFFPYHMESRAAYDGAGEESHRIIAAVMPHGDKDKWMEMAATLRTMQAARVMLATSFASVLLQPLQQRPFIFHLWANSRSGKTAVLKAAVSIYGDPNVLLRSYNSTAVGIEHTAGTVRNIPLALDELQSLSLKYENLSRMMYMLGNGIGKMRGDRIGGTQKMQTWCNTILSTGEQPITVQNSMDGENTRVMELYASPIGDTDFSRTVHQTAAENYGFAGQMFMDYLFHEYELEKGTSKLRQAYTNFRDEFVSMYAMLYEKCTSIHLEFVAVLVFADFIASKAVFNAGEEACGAAWEMGFELLEALKKEQKADAVERAWDTVKEWIASNQEHFEVKHLNEVAREPRLGRYEPGEKKTYILPNCLRKMLIDNGFSYEKSIRGFKDRGYVENRQENQRVGKSSVKVIIANIEQAYEYRKASEFF